MGCIVRIWQPKELRQEVDVMLPNKMPAALRHRGTSARSIWTHNVAVVELSLIIPIVAIAKVTLVYIITLMGSALFLPGVTIWIRWCSLLGLHIGVSSRSWAELTPPHLMPDVVQDGLVS